MKASASRLRLGITIALTSILFALAATGATGEGPVPRPAERSKSCGTYSSTSIYPKGKVTAIRGVGCSEARRVAKRFDHTGKAKGKWKCGYGHGGRRLFSCGYGGSGGSLTQMKHALKATGKN